MLLRLESGSTGGVLAESEKATDLIAELCYGLVVGKFEVDWSTSRSHSYISYHDIYNHCAHFLYMPSASGVRGCKIEGFLDQPVPIHKE